jgi:hypothetical protein
MSYFPRMSPSVEASVERFLRRIEGTEATTLQRNLRAGVYGPPGSSRRAVVELAIESRLAASARTLAVATQDERADLKARVDRAERVARRALWLAALALVAAAIAFATSYWPT